MIASAVALAAIAQPASAQFLPQYGNMSPQSLRGPQGFPNQPALSPWLNLTRGGNPATNYFLGVLPEIDRRATQAQLGAAVTDLERRVEAPPPAPALGPADDLLGGLAGGGPAPTGHASALGGYS